MADTPATDTVVANPTYMADIRFFFRPEDVDHMAAKGVDLGTYDGVKDNAADIASITTQPGGIMPPDQAGKWSADRSQTFNNWIRNGFPLGTATPVTQVEGTTPTRQRKDVTTLTDDEFTLLTTAFTGLMERSPTADGSYFAIAGGHGLPQRWCQHHVDRFNPWHRYYLMLFEDALRSVPGCSDVTLPYWDISTDLPDRLQHPPFDQYVLPIDPAAGVNLPPGVTYFPYTTQRNSVAQIAQNIQDFQVLDDIATSLVQSVWGRSDVNGYQNFSIQAHDAGHVSVGPTMADQNVSSFDPVFWFYHCNLDRLWLSWQTRVGATTLAGFKSTLEGNTSWLSLPLRGYTATSEQVIETEVSYDRLDLPATETAAMENTIGSIPAARAFAIKSSNPVSVRVKGIDRMKIPGAFVVNLLADGEPLAKRAFFQPIDPQNCETCAEHAVVNIDFRLPQDQIVDKTLSVRIDVPSQEEIGATFPLSRAGNPTINARLLVEDA